MKKLALGALVALFAACGGGGGGTHLIDSGSNGSGSGSDIDASSVCNPVSQSGCAAGEKCTWIIDADGSGGADDIAHIGCAPDGSIAADAACTAATSTANGGHDDCVKGTYCIGGSCETICDLQNAASCDTNHACARYSNVFETGGTAVAGVCDPQCDPLTQALKAGNNTAACGSTSPSAPTKGCFSGDIVTFTCSPTGATHYTKTDRVPAAETNGTVYINSCAPGYLALFYQMTGSMTVVCDGLCAPLNTDNTAALMNNAKGDGTVLGKQPTDPAPGRGPREVHAVRLGRQGSVAAEDCRYMWTILFDSAGNPVDRRVQGQPRLLLRVLAVQVRSDGWHEPDDARVELRELPAARSRDHGHRRRRERLGLLRQRDERLPGPRRAAEDDARRAPRPRLGHADPPHAPLVAT